MANSRPLRPFQREVLRLIMNGKNVILQAPTGAGKTDAALAPFIQNLEHGSDKLPYSCLYATPMRVLSTQFLKKYRDRIAKVDQERGGKIAEPYQDLQLPPISIQTGEQPEDPQFESLLTFCTIDQLLASFLGVPYSIDGRHANINVAAVAGSYLVLDEFHLYPLLRENESCFGARTTTLAMLRLLQSTTRFILMTATFSTTLLEKLAALLNASIVQVSDEDLQLISAGRERKFEVSESALNAEMVLSKHQEKSCSLVVCNTVLRAQMLYWRIKDEAVRRGCKVILLHSRLTAEDRAARSAEVMHELGQAPKQWEDDKRYGWKDGTYYGKDLIVIATQVVEVGLDISVQVLHTELAPANSLVQRAGRCARFAQQQGTVIVYPLLDEEGNELSYKPYHKELCEKTWYALREQQFHLTVVGFREEQALLDAVHTQEDSELLVLYENQQGHGTIVERVFTSLNENKRSITSSLIRDVAQIHILIHNTPKETITEEPWNWQSFALHPDSLASSWSALEKKATQLGLDWVGKKAVALPSEDAEADNKRKTLYTWDDIPTSGNTSATASTLREALMVVLPTQLATYHEELGFVLLDGRLEIRSSGYQSTPLEGKGSDYQGYVLKHQSYTQHIEGLVEAYNRNVSRRMQYLIRRLEDELGLPARSIDQAIRLAIACHDLGKLGEQWQRWAWDWQTLLFEEKGYPVLPDQSYFFAKTDFDSQSAEQKALRKQMTMQRPPHHACESVVLGAALLAESLFATVGEEKGEILVRAACGAIAHHHTTNAHTYETIRLKDGALDAIDSALRATRQQETWTYDPDCVDLARIEGDDLLPMNLSPFDAPITRPRQGRMHELETWVYFVIVRALRLSDQRADKYE